MTWIVAENVENPGKTHVTNGGSIFHTDAASAQILCDILNGSAADEAAIAFAEASLLADTGESWQPKETAKK